MPMVLKIEHKCCNDDLILLPPPPLFYNVGKAADSLSTATTAPKTPTSSASQTTQTSPKPLSVWKVSPI